MSYADFCKVPSFFFISSGNVWISRRRKKNMCIPVVLFLRERCGFLVGKCVYSRRVVSAGNVWIPRREKNVDSRRVVSLRVISLGNARISCRRMCVFPSCCRECDRVG